VPEMMIAYHYPSFFFVSRICHGDTGKLNDISCIRVKFGKFHVKLVSVICWFDKFHAAATLSTLSGGSVKRR
jgi:hypothetical protein